MVSRDGKVTRTLPHIQSGTLNQAVVFDLAAFGSCPTLCLAFTNTGRRRTTSSKYLSAATACAVELPASKPFGPNHQSLGRPQRRRFSQETTCPPPTFTFPDPIFDMHPPDMPIMLHIKCIRQPQDRS